MEKVKAVNCRGHLRVTKVANGKIEIQAVFSKKDASPIATLDWETVYKTLNSRKKVHTFKGNLRRIVVDKPNSAFRGVYSKNTVVRMFFNQTPGGCDLMIVRKVDLKRALLLTSRW